VDPILTFWHNLGTVLFGLIVGSFLNVVIYRLPRGQSIVLPRSSCTNCRQPLRWRDNIPLVSYLILRAKCRTCSSTISFRYPAVEFLTALLFLASQYHFGWSPLLVLRDWSFLAILIAVTFIDLEHRIIPDVLSLGGLVLGLVTCWWVPDLGWVSSFGGAALGFCIFYSIAGLYERMSGRSGLGGGDIKLLAMLGAFLGPRGVFATILISSVFGSIVGIGWATIVGQKKVMKTAIPFGPFLVLGALYYYFFGDTLWLRFMIPT